MSALPKNLAGPALVKGLEKERQSRLQKDLWPYEHLFPPPNSIPVHGSDLGIQTGAVPLAAASVVFCIYQVPEGFKFIMDSILMAYSGAFNPGDSFFTVTVNPNGGPQATFVQGLIRSPITLGAWQYGTRWFFDRPYEFSALDILQANALNVNIPSPANNSYVGGFFGYLIPRI